MTPTSDRTAGTRVRRRLPWVGVTLALLVVAAAVFAFRRRASTPAESAAAPNAGVGGMAGMPGMSAVPSGDASVRLTSDQGRQFGVTFGTVEARTLSNVVRSAGVVSVDEGRLATVAPRFAGYVERLFVGTTGAPVTRGQPLAAIYAPEVLVAEEELLVARRLGASLGTSDVPGVSMPTVALVASARRRLRLLGVSDAEIDAVLRSGRAAGAVMLRAPTSGVVLERRVTAGQSVGVGEALFTLADLAAVWVEAELREADAGSVRVGTGADVELAAYPGRPIKGTVSYLQPTLDAPSRTVRARVVVANTDRRLRPGMLATVRLTTLSRRALTVPGSAVVRTGERVIVFVDLGGGRLRPQDVEAGRIEGDLVEVLSGLEPGQRVVTSAQYLLESESNLAEVMRSMIGQAGAQDMANMPGMEDMPGMGTKGADTRGLPPAASPLPNGRPNARPKGPR